MDGLDTFIHDKKNDFFFVACPMLNYERHKVF